MAQITRFPFTRHLRSDPSHHVLHYRRGRLVRSGRGVESSGESWLKRYWHEGR